MNLQFLNTKIVVQFVTNHKKINICIKGHGTISDIKHFSH